MWDIYIHTYKRRNKQTASCNQTDYCEHLVKVRRATDGTTSTVLGLTGRNNIIIIPLQIVFLHYTMYITYIYIHIYISI